MSDAKCIFCEIVAGKVPCFKLYEDERTMAFADINPLAPGHVLVIPKNHAENIFRITPGDLAAVHQTSQKLAHAINKVLEPRGIAVLQLNGRGANQVVMHYHVHLIPRNRPDDGIDFLEWDATPGDMAEIEVIAEKIAAAM